MLVFAAGHAMGAADSWSPPGDTVVLQSMRSFQFNVMGVSRTYWHFYVGFGYYITVLLLLLAVMLWQLAALERTHPGRARPMIVGVLVATLAGTWVLWTFVFVLPALFSLACAACLGFALATGRRRLAKDDG